MRKLPGQSPDDYYELKIHKTNQLFSNLKRSLFFGINKKMESSILEFLRLVLAEIIPAIDSTVTLEDFSEFYVCLLHIRVEPCK